MAELIEEIKPKDMIPGATAIRIMCDIIAKNTIIVSPKASWFSQKCSYDRDSLVYVYAGNGLLYRTQVGNIYIHHIEILVQLS